MIFEKELAKLFECIPDCVGVGCVDASTGLLLGIQTDQHLPEELLGLMAASVAEIFNGSNVSLIERLFKRLRGQEDDDLHYLQEIILNSEKLTHVLMRCKGNPEHIVAFMCRSTVDLGVVVAKARMVLPVVESHLYRGLK